MRWVHVCTYLHRGFMHLIELPSPNSHQLIIFNSDLNNASMWVSRHSPLVWVHVRASLTFSCPLSLTHIKRLQLYSRAHDATRFPTTPFQKLCFSSLSPFLFLVKHLSVIFDDMKNVWLNIKKKKWKSNFLRKKLAFCMKK